MKDRGTDLNPSYGKGRGLRRSQSRALLFCSFRTPKVQSVSYASLHKFIGIAQFLLLCLWETSAEFLLRKTREKSRDTLAPS